MHQVGLRNVPPNPRTTTGVPSNARYNGTKPISSIHPRRTEKHSESNENEEESADLLTTLHSTTTLPCIQSRPISSPHNIQQKPAPASGQKGNKKGEGKGHALPLTPPRLSSNSNLKTKMFISFPRRHPASGSQPTYGPAP